MDLAGAVEALNRPPAAGWDFRVIAAGPDLIAEIPMGRIGTVDDIAGIVALIVSPRGRYMTGATLQVDGGLLRGIR